MLTSFAALVSAELPRIGNLEPEDPVFARQQEAVRLYYRQSSSGTVLPELEVYRYEIAAQDTLFGIAARLAVPYSSVATLNRMENSSLAEPGSSILLPSIPGLFVPLAPETDLELVMHDLRREDRAEVVQVEVRGHTTAFRFYPGEDFAPEERSTFLGLLFRAPVRTMTVSSGFGPRSNPVTGAWSFHAGIDVVAPRGTPVVAARSGQVSEVGQDDRMGNYVLLEHSGGFTTFYGHLDTVLVSLNDSVNSGMIVGTVGSTGITTGSHLHFEIRHDGDPRDPMKLLP
jgi:murein DD-endopeptidase MepM/ murein hydrolase activator NlpD